METKAVLKKCVGAARRWRSCACAGQLIPDQTVLINAIPLLEAKDSSEIENIVTTNDDLFREASLVDGRRRPGHQGGAALPHGALSRAIRTLSERPLTTRTVIEICRDHQGRRPRHSRDARHHAAATRSPARSIYTPPEGADRLRDAARQLGAVPATSRRDLDPLVRMAVLHYQFEAIHPFTDGNGRTGRILNILCLIQDGLLDLPTLYLSRHILRTRGDYYRLLAGVTTAGRLGAVDALHARCGRGDRAAGRTGKIIAHPRPDGRRRPRYVRTQAPEDLLARAGRADLQRSPTAASPTWSSADIAKRASGLDAT